MIGEEHYQVLECSSESFLALSRTNPIELSLVVVDLDHFSSTVFGQGHRFFQEIYPDIPTILIGSRHLNQIKMEEYPSYLIGCLREFDKSLLLPLVHSAIRVYKAIQEKKSLSFSVGKPVIPLGFVGQCPVLKKMQEEVALAAAQDGPVFIEGESGTRKDVIATMIHLRGDRSKAPFHVFPVLAVVREMYELDLFGIEPNTHELMPEGHIGQIEKMNRGTIFIDAIDNMHAASQARLLAFLKTKSFYRIFSSRSQMCDTRIFAAGTVRMRDSLESGTFSRELYDMLSATTVRIPPVREYAENIPDWIAIYSQWFSESLGREKPPEFTSSAIEKMMNHSWPRNMDELALVIRQIIYTDTTGLVRPEDVVFYTSPRQQAASISNLVGLSCDEVEKRLILETLSKEQGNRPATAKVLDISEKTLYNKLKEYEQKGIEVLP